MRIAVVGSCATGKSTVVSELRQRGHDAHVVSQEHSIVSSLWNHASPDLLVLLEADYHVIRRRRGGVWPRWLYDLQRERLSEAKKHADLIIDTSSRSIDETLATIATFIAQEESSAHGGY